MSERNYSKSIFVAGTLAGTLALTGCANNANFSSKDSSTKILIKDAYIDSGSTFRTDPAKIIDGDGSDNACLTKRKSAVVVENQSGLISNGIGYDANGPWVGFALEKLPDDIQKACNDDKNGIVWVIKGQVQMDNAVNAITPQS